MKRKSKSSSAGSRAPAPSFQSNWAWPRKKRTEAGKALRARCPRKDQGDWNIRAKSCDPINLIQASSRGRLPHLVPLRYARMLASPFTFLRGSALLMARDLATTPSTGYEIQVCGDCHLANFGGWATPERNQLFGINDFDETLLAPWEWDVKRLAASFWVAARSLGFREGSAEACVCGVAHAYREQLARYARMSALEVWYARIDADEILRFSKGDPKASRLIADDLQKARALTPDRMLPKYTQVVRGRRRIVDRPPIVVHPRKEAGHAERLIGLFDRYKSQLPPDRRGILDHYDPVDAAMKVVGVGSVGTRCGVVLLLSGAEDALFLQVKEAGPSVLEGFARPARYASHGERVIAGQHLLQAGSDLFLGWARDEKDGRDYYFRQLKDMKFSPPVEELAPGGMEGYAHLCGLALACAHARAGDAAVLTGYMGQRDAFDEALARFARSYADQTERDFELFTKACKSNRLSAKKGISP